MHGGFFKNSERTMLAHQLRYVFVSRMLKKAVQQGRNERRCEEVQTPLRVGRSPFEWILASGISPPVIPISDKLDSIR